MTDIAILFPIFFAAFAIFAFWVVALISIARGKSLRKWHDDGAEKPVSFGVTKLCWFLFVFSTTLVGMVTYFVWQRRLRTRVRAQIQADAERYADGISADDRAAINAAGEALPVWRQIIGWALFFLCFFVIFLLSGGMLFFVIALFTLAGFLGTTNPYGTYHPVYGGFFIHLARWRLPALKDLPKAERRGKFSALCAAVQSKHPFQKRHGLLAGFILAQIVCIIVPLTVEQFSGKELVPEEVGGYLILWLFALVIFKVLIWDALTARRLYTLLKAEAA